MWYRSLVVLFWLQATLLRELFLGCYPPGWNAWWDGAALPRANHV